MKNTREFEHNIISIITVCLNNSEGLNRTMDSVSVQKDAEFEYIVIDGGSTDDTHAVINKHEKSIDILVSEPDQGVYSAMNKGIKKASGDYCIFLNAGDCLVDDGVIERICHQVESNKDIYYSNIVSLDDKKIAITNFPAELDINFFISGMINHQNCIIKRKLFDEFGMYNEKFRIMSDWYFFLKAFYIRKLSSELLYYPIAFYEGNGISANSKYDSIRFHEINDAIRDVFGPVAPSIQELFNYKHSVFGSIVGVFGYTKILSILLRTYRFLARNIPCLRSNNNIPW